MEYCTSVGCSGHKDVILSSTEKWYGSCENFYLNKTEVNRMEWWYWEVKNICGNCKKSDCFTCEGWAVIKHKLKFIHGGNRYGSQPVLFRVPFYKHLGQICPFLIETVGLVKSRTIEHFVILAIL